MPAMSRQTLNSSSVEETFAIGEALGALLPAGTFVALSGNLGAGKTHLVKGIARGLGIGGWRGLRSPTFTLMQSYFDGRLPLHHIDFYRLADAVELPGEIEEAILDRDAVTVIEWAEAWHELWPEKCVRIEIEYVGENEREIAIDDPHSLCPAIEGVSEG